MFILVHSFKQDGKSVNCQISIAKAVEMITSSNFTYSPMSYQEYEQEIVNQMLSDDYNGRSWTVGELGGIVMKVVINKNKIYE
jgi:hypothetical protein